MRLCAAGFSATTDSRKGECVVRITIIQDQLRVGGTERQTLHLAQAAAAEGHEVHLIIFRPGGELFPVQQARDYTITVLQSWDSGMSVYAPGLIGAIGASRPERILCMGRSANCYAGWIQQQFRTVPVVATLRTGKRLQPWHRWALSRVSGILVNTLWWAQRLKEEGLIGEAIKVVPNALLRSAPAEGERWTLRTEEGIDSDTIVFLQVASFRKGKRQAALLRLLAGWDRSAKPAPWVLWFVGDGPQRAACERLADELGMAAKVRFFGYDERPGRYYAAADVALSLSQEDSLPNFLIEAQSAGLPVIAEAFRGVEESFMAGYSGFLLPGGDSDGFLKTVSLLCACPGLRRRMGAAGVRLALRKFSPAEQVRAVLEFLDTL